MIKSSEFVMSYNLNLSTFTGLWYQFLTFIVLCFLSVQMIQNAEICWYIVISYNILDISILISDISLKIQIDLFSSTII